jgi:methionyl-tRNA formyltransferase
MINVVYMGTPEYAKVILEELIEHDNIEVSLVITQPDRPVGRKKILTAPPVKELANKHNIEVLQPDRLKQEGIKEAIAAKGADFIVVAAFGQLLPKEILDIAPSINLHASILPKYRGASPIQSALLNGDEYSGVTAMLMDEGLDTGDMLGFRYIKSADAPTLDLMMTKLSTLAAKLCVDVLVEYDNILPIKQLNALATKCGKVKKDDGLVDFESALELVRKHNAYFGWPGVFLESGLKLYGVELIEDSSKNSAGEILEITKKYVAVGCSQGSVKIKELQPKSKSKMDAKAYIAGKRLKVGDKIL